MDDVAKTADASLSGPLSSLYLYRFGSAEFDAARHELRVGGLIVDSQPKPLQMLALLLQRPGEVLSKDELAAALWPGTGPDDVPSDAMIANAASKLRLALGEDNARQLVTVPRVGYRFDGQVERIALGRRQSSGTDLVLAPGEPVPGRAHYRLVESLGDAPDHIIWLARQPRSSDARVFKFALDGERLAGLKREVTLSRLLHEALGAREDIVRVLDWNFEQPPYWIEMPCAGQSLERWAGEPAPGGGTQLAATAPTQRVNWLAEVAATVAAAHDLGVLHQDLKPANILIAPAGPDAWHLRLTDFGSGRLLDPDLPQRLRVTRLGLTVSSLQTSSGTPLYMAPELLRGESPTLRSDVFALGVILYQLLVGDFKRPLTPGWEREVDDELLREDIAAATDQDAARRLGSAAELAARLRELPARREARAAQRAETARHSALQQRLARGEARRPWVIAAGAALALGLASSLWLYAQQRQASAELQREVAVSQALDRLMREDLIASANPARSGRADITVAEALATVAGRIDQRFGADTPALRGRLHAAVQAALGELSRAADAVQAGQRAVQALAAAGADAQPQLQAARLRLALDLVQLSRLDEAGAVLRDIEAAPGGAAALSQGQQARLLYVKSWLVAGDLSLQASTALLEEAMRIAAQASDLDAQARRVIAFGLADNYTLLERYAQAEALYLRIREEQIKQYGAQDARTLYTQVGLGRTLMLQRREAEAEAMLQPAAAGLAKALGAGHRQALTARDQLAELRFNRRDFAAAAREWTPVRDGFAALMGAGSSYTLTVQTNRAMALHYAGDPRAAERELSQALTLARGFLKDADPQLQQIRYALADCLLDMGRSAQAGPLLGGLDAAALNTAQPRPDWPARLAYQRARLALAAGERAAADALVAQASAAGLVDDGHLGASQLAALTRP